MIEFYQVMFDFGKGGLQSFVVHAKNERIAVKRGRKLLSSDKRKEWRHNAPLFSVEVLSRMKPRKPPANAKKKDFRAKPRIRTTIGSTIEKSRKKNVTVT